MGKITCGIFLFDKNGYLLIGKPTGGNVWSIPKGLMDEGETYQQTAIREFKEESNIDLNINDLTILDQVKYPNKNKTLQPFYIFSKLDKSEFDEPVCYSMVSAKDGRPEFPEICEFRWVGIYEALELLHSTQKEVVMSLHLKWVKEWVN